MKARLAFARPTVSRGAAKEYTTGRVSKDPLAISYVSIIKMEKEGGK